MRGLGSVVSLTDHCRSESVASPFYVLSREAPGWRGSPGPCGWWLRAFRCVFATGHCKEMSLCPSLCPCLRRRPLSKAEQMAQALALVCPGKPMATHSLILEMRNARQGSQWVERNQAPWGRWEGGCGWGFSLHPPIMFIDVCQGCSGQACVLRRLTQTTLVTTRKPAAPSTQHPLPGAQLARPAQRHSGCHCLPDRLDFPCVLGLTALHPWALELNLALHTLCQFSK